MVEPTDDALPASRVLTPFERMFGVLLGTALGDALGLPYEGLTPSRVAGRLAARPGPLAHSLVRGRGVVSDDTEHTCMIGHALAESRGEVERFRRALGRALGRWLLTLPPGVGLATLRGCTRLLLAALLGPRLASRCGLEVSGVASAGNGPAMRAAILGLAARDDDHLRALVRAQARLTHTDARAEDGALLVARWARDARASPQELARAIDDVRDATFRQALRAAVDAALAASSRASFAAGMGYTRGVSGFVVETVPAAVFCWLRHRYDPAGAIEAAVRLGGDTDSVAAIVGAWLGAESGPSVFPAAWSRGLCDWPYNPTTLRALARAWTDGTEAPRARWYAGPLQLARNLVVLVIVIGHVVLRALGRLVGR